MRRKILTAIALLAGVLSTPAAVTVQGWWHFGEGPDYYADFSGNGRRFGMAYSSGTTGGAGAGVVPFGIGGPVAGFVSTNCLYWTPQHVNAAAMWGPGNATDPVGGYRPPATNYTIECWLLPEGTGIAAGAGSTWFFASGSGDFSQPTRDPGTGAGGVYFQITNDTSVGYSKIGAFVVPNNTQGVPTTVQIGDYVKADTNRWMHVAVVNDNGINTFYVDGVAKGAPQTANTIPNGNIFAGGSPGTAPTFDGYLDELRICTFAPGQFAISDLLLRGPGPSIVSQPQSATVWTGGAAPFEITAAFDNTLTYQWRKGGANIAGATAAVYTVPTVTTADTGSTFDCVLTANGTSSTSSVATLTVIDPNPSNVAVYRNAILAEPSLLAYFPVDNDSGATLTNVKDATHNGALEGGAYYDGRTNRAFGQRALSFSSEGDAVVQNNPAYEFAANGTIEAVVLLSSSTLIDPTIVTEGDYGTMFYLIGATKDGGSLICTNDSGGMSWPLPQSLMGRRVHLAFVFENATNVTAYVNGEALATKTWPSFGTPQASPLFIGGRGPNMPGYSWRGSIDEVALYSAALSQAAIQVHYANLIYGTNTSGPSIVSQSTSKTLLAGGSPSLSVTAAGTPPLSYQWTSNGVAIAGATKASLTLANTTPSFSADYGVTIVNSFGTKNSDPINLAFVAPAGYAATIMASHPNAYWRLDETGGTTAVDSAGYNDAAYSGTFTLGADGFTTADKAVAFNNGKAQAPWSAALNNPAGPFTIEFWAKPNDTSLGVQVSTQYRTGGRMGVCFYQNNGGANIVGDLGINGSTGVNRFTGDTVAPAAGVWNHVAFTYDGTTANFYVNGFLDDTGAIAYGTDFQANPAAPFVIGVRNDGGFPYLGTIDEVAVYDHALSQAEVTARWSAIWYLATITQQPVGVATNEWSTITLTGAASGIPNTYQWTKNGTVITAVNNPDGTAHYPNGVTSTTLTIAQVHPADAGQYRLVVNNPVGNATSDPATVSVTSDTTPPEVTFAGGLGTPDPYYNKTPFLVKISFSERIDTNTALGNFTLDGGVTVSQMTLSSDWYSAILNTSGLTPGQKYTVVVNGVKDQAQTPNTLNGKTVTFVAPVLTQGSLVWDYYYPISGGVAGLLSAPIYPLAPNTNAVVTRFDSTQLYSGNDLNTVFGALGDNYGASVSGWITPKVTTNYYFFLRSDDASRLLISSDDNPLNAYQIAEETGCCNAFLDPGNPQTSGLIPLEASKRYFIQALYTEGSGGDYVQVAWKMEGDTNAAATLQPISGDVLSAYAPVPPAKFATPTYNPTTGQLTITWTGTGVIEQSADLKTWTPVTGNPTSPYNVNVSGASHLFYRIRQ